MTSSVRKMRADECARGFLFTKLLACVVVYRGCHARDWHGNDVSLGNCRVSSSSIKDGAVRATCWRAAASNVSVVNVLDFARLLTRAAVFPRLIGAWGSVSINGSCWAARLAALVPINPVIIGIGEKREIRAVLCHGAMIT